MKHRRWIVMGLCLVLAMAGAAAALEPTDGNIGVPSPRVAFVQAPEKLVEIRVAGNETISKHAILAVVEAAGIRLGMDITPELINTGVDAIRAMGWFAEVVPTITKAEGGSALTYTVVEYPRVNEIEIVGNKSITTEEIQKVMSTKAASVFNRDAFREDITAIENLYQDRGYSAVISEQPELDEEGTLHIKIAERTIEEIRIEGNTKTKTYVIRREMRTKPGDAFNVEKIVADLNRIYNLDFFEPPIDRRIEIGSDLDKVILIVVVKEKRTGNVVAGVVYSSTTKWLGRIEVTEPNWRGRATGLDLMWEQGGYGNKSSFEVGWRQPWIDKKNSSLDLRLYNKIVYRFSSSSTFGLEDSTRYNERHKGGQISYSRPWGDYARNSITLRHEDVLTQEIAGYEAPPVLIQQDGTITSVTLRHTRDTRDYYTDPAAGGYNAAWVEYGVGDIVNSGDVSFVKYNGELRRYWSIGKKRLTPETRARVVAARLRIGLSTGTMPFFEQYFLGGSETVRGYLDNRFWGDKQFLMSVEYRHPIAKAIQGVLFVDVGDAWGSPYADQSSEDFAQDTSFAAHVGYGLGVRVQTPIGPIRIDYGMGEDGSRTHFSIGHPF